MAPKETAGQIVILPFIVLLSAAAFPALGAEDVKPEVNWADFLSRSDLVWTEMPTG